MKVEELPEPLQFLVNDIIELNQEWLENHQETYGADYLKENELTRNQEKWVEDIAEEMRPDNQ